MTESEIRKLLERQRTFFSTGKTLPVSFRLRQLEKLKRSIQKNEPLLRHALKKDLGKSNMESYMCEIGLTLSELSWMQRHVRSLAKNRTVPTPLSQFAAHSYRSPIPYGTVLIMSPWNYPLLLTLEPLIDARKYRHPEAKCLRSCLTCHDQRNHRNHFPGRLYFRH